MTALASTRDTGITFRSVVWVGAGVGVVGISNVKSLLMLRF